MKRSPLKRKTPISKKGRKTKGQVGEREVVEMSRRLWPDIRRNFGSGSQGGSDFTGTPGYALEAKWQETCRIFDWIAQCEAAASPTETPVVVHRRSHRPWHAVLPAEDLKPLLEIKGSPQTYTVQTILKRISLWRLIDEADERRDVMLPGATPIVEFGRPDNALYSDLPYEDFLGLVEASQL